MKILLYLIGNKSTLFMDKQKFFSVIDAIDFSKWNDSYIYLIMENSRRYYTFLEKLENFRKNEDLVLEVDQTSGDHLDKSF